MFKTRLISGIILVLLSIILITTGGDLLLFSTMAISLVGMFELYRIFEIQNKLLGFVGYASAVAFYSNFKWHFVSDVVLIFMVTMILTMFVYVFTYPKYKANQVSMSFFGIFYVAVMLSYVYQIRNQVNNGLYIAFLIFICSWGCDTCAYCAGKLFGKHKMSPKLSPKKSIEGAVGGVLGTVVLTVIYTSIFKNKMCSDTREIIILAAVSAIAALVSMVGDLTASAIKRNYDVKDYGKLIPGHGGILDRFDSMIITAPIIYYLAHYML
ncbi:phosphatidate cytidylyltransferase [Lachnobacterium bovis]|uniref:phosphatidate cytidylyltransferase n=1 Tax=Lachnobacterium bovis TaxID=140626 RepID=UPI0003B37572|nr:phosphatidate cytidylyltransferase [Lachnobacterium bovis]